MHGTVTGTKGIPDPVKLSRVPGLGVLILAFFFVRETGRVPTLQRIQQPSPHLPPSNSHPHPIFRYSLIMSATLGHRLCTDQKCRLTRTRKSRHLHNISITLFGDKRTEHKCHTRTCSSDVSTYFTEIVALYTPSQERTGPALTKSGGRCASSPRHSRRRSVTPGMERHF